MTPAMRTASSRQGRPANLPSVKDLYPQGPEAMALSASRIGGSVWQRVRWWHLGAALALAIVGGVWTGLDGSPDSRVGRWLAQARVLSTRVVDRSSQFVRAWMDDKPVTPEGHKARPASEVPTQGEISSTTEPLAPPPAVTRTSAN